MSTAPALDPSAARAAAAELYAVEPVLGAAGAVGNDVEHTSGAGTPMVEVSSAARAAAVESPAAPRVADIRAAVLEDVSTARAAAVSLYAGARPAVAMAGMSSAELVEFLAECQAGIRALEAASTLAVARLAATEEVVTEDGCVQEVSQGLGYRRLDAPDLVSDVLGVCAQAAAARVDDAVVLAAKLPLLVDAMGAGRVDAYRAGIIAGELREAPRAVCDAVLARIDGSLGQPGGVLRRRTRRALEIVDPDWLVTKTTRARSELGLRMVPNGDSTDTWTAILPTEQSRHAWAAVEPLAKQLRDTQGITLDQARAQAMTQLILGNCTGTFHLHLAVPTDHAEELAARIKGQPGPRRSSEEAGIVSPDDEPLSPHAAAKTTSTGLASRAAEATADGAVTASPIGKVAKGPSPAIRANQACDVAVASGCATADASHNQSLGPGSTIVDIASRAPGRDGGLVAAGKVNDWAVVTGMGSSGTTIVPHDWLSKVVAGQHGTVQIDVIGCDSTTGGFTTDPVPVSVPSPGKAAPAQPPRSTPALSTDASRPTPAIRAYVKARDQHCRFPGCSTSAYFTDLDHVRPWPDGPTRPDNLVCLCRRHHRVKQRPGWTARLNPDRSMDWTDPTGRTRTTQPVDHLGTTLPRSSPAMSATPTAEGVAGSSTGFGDPLWDGDYHDADAYIGGTPTWLLAELDLKNRLAAARRLPSRHALHPEQHSPLEQALVNQILDQVGDPMSRDQPLDKPATVTRWLASRRVVWTP